MLNNFKIAITGGIGSGKSEVSKIISEKGYTVINADLVAKEVMSQKNINSEICNHFDLKPDKNGFFVKKELADLIFNDNHKLQWLNNFIHPIVINYILKKMNENKGLIFAEIPLLFESGTQNLFDYILIIKRDLQKRIESVNKRDKISEKEILDRIKNQYNYENLIKIEHTVIYNDFDLKELKEQVGKFLNEMQNKII